MEAMVRIWRSLLRTQDITVSEPRHAESFRFVSYLISAKRWIGNFCFLILKRRQTFVDIYFCHFWALYRKMSFPIILIYKKNIFFLGIFFKIFIYNFHTFDWNWIISWSKTSHIIQWLVTISQIDTMGRVGNINMDFLLCVVCSLKGK